MFSRRAGSAMAFSRSGCLACRVLVGSPVAFSAYRYLLTHVTPAVATRYAFVNPLVAIFLGAFFAGEQVTRGEWVVCGVILIGVFSIFRGKSATLRGK